VSGASSGALQSVSGLASGLDTSEIVSALMDVARRPETALQNRITVEQARQSAYRDVLAELQELTSAYQDLTDVSTWAAVQSVSSSDPAAVAASVTGGAAAGAYDVAVTQLARANQYATAGTDPAAAADVIHIATASGVTDVAISAGDSLATIAEKITHTAGSPVYATILNGRLVLSGKQTGTAAAITSVTTDGGSGLSFAETQTAQDAAFTVDGVAYTSGSNVVTTALAGVTLTLAGKTASTTVTVGAPAPDTDAISSRLDAFVEEYNAVLADIQGRLAERPVASPADDAERAKGVLYGDQGLERLLSQLRNAFADTIGGGTYTSLAQVGLSTGAAVGTGALSADSIAGKLTVDHGKLDAALAADFDAVKALFTNATGSYATEGLGQRLAGILGPYTSSSLLGGYLDTKIDGETETVAELQRQVADWDERLALKQQLYERQFTAMESALAQAQAISAQLAAQIVQLQGP